MWRFAQYNNRVLYVEPSFSMLRTPNDYKRARVHNKFFVPTLEKYQNNIYLLGPPKGLPYWSKPFVSKINYKWFGKIIEQKAQRLNFINYILWIYRPEYYNALSFMNYKKIVFDLSDDLAAYKGKSDSQYSYIKECIEGLMTRSNLVFTTARTLYNKYSEIYGEKKIYYIPNGFDAKLFFRNNYELPPDIEKITKPIIGFVGVLFEFLDYDLIVYIAEKNPDKSIVLIGPVESSAEKKVRKLLRYKNIYLLGQKLRHLIPAYIHSFDVCINPFIVNEVSRSANPLKLYEYIACMKPVISTKMESLEQEEIAKEIAFASDYYSFNTLINKKLSSVVSENDKMRKINIVKNYTWDNLFLKVVAILQEHKMYI
jgi:hypothetical protein